MHAAHRNGSAQCITKSVDGKVNPLRLTVKPSEHGFHPTGTS